MFPVILSHIPDRSSTRQLNHFAQLQRSGHFRQYDKRIFRLGPPPKDYNLSKVTAPVYLICGRNDWLSDLRDVKKLYSMLPNVAGTLIVKDEKWNHLDFMYGIDAPELVYKYVIEQIYRVLALEENIVF